jgi:hypothetical protein
MNHKWIKNQTRAVKSGCGRPYGVDVSETCARCGVSRGSGPQSTHTGARVIRRWIKGPWSNRLDRLPACTSYTSYDGN